MADTTQILLLPLLLIGLIPRARSTLLPRPLRLRSDQRRCPQFRRLREPHSAGEILMGVNPPDKDQSTPKSKKVNPAVLEGLGLLLLSLATVGTAWCSFEAAAWGAAAQGAMNLSTASSRRARSEEHT